MQEKILRHLNFQDFNICPNILHVDMDGNAGGIAKSSFALKCSRTKKKTNNSSKFFLKTLFFMVSAKQSTI